MLTTLHSPAVSGVNKSGCATKALRDCDKRLLVERGNRVVEQVVGPVRVGAAFARFPFVELPARLRSWRDERSLNRARHVFSNRRRPNPETLRC